MCRGLVLANQWHFKIAAEAGKTPLIAGPEAWKVAATQVKIRSNPPDFLATRPSPSAEPFGKLGLLTCNLHTQLREVRPSRRLPARMGERKGNASLALGAFGFDQWRGARGPFEDQSF
jgi:hypothetical protein